jgi:type VI secretion system protein ImpF
MVVARLNPTLFDKLVADLELEGLRETRVDQEAQESSRSTMRFYAVPRIERFNERALRTTIRRELNWLLNTTNLESLEDLTPYPQVATSVLNFGVRDLAGRTHTRQVIQQHGKHIRDAIRAFEPRIDPAQLTVESVRGDEKSHAVTYIIRGDVTSAVTAMPVEFKTDIEPDTASVTLRE